MKIIDPGHLFELDQLDSIDKFLLRHVKREGNNFPGNIGAYPGPTTQEVLRAEIARLRYVNMQKQFNENFQAIHYIQLAILFLERRAKIVRGEILQTGFEGIELIPVCPTCGHIECTKIH